MAVLAALLGIATPTGLAQSNEVSTKTFASEGRDFLAKEVAAHFGNIKTLQPPPDRVFSALTVGDFSWGSFARALAAQADVGGTRNLAGKDTARAIAEIGLIESRQGGKAFSQLYSTLALRHYGTDLSRNAVWQSMSDAERKEWQSLLDPSRFYDPKTRRVINLPENYLGVAARVAAMSYQMGVLKDKAFLDSVVESAAKQFTDGAIYADDNPPTGRYDRYSHEYARFCWDAAEIAGRTDILDKLKPSLRTQYKLWWDIVSPEGYGYNWGRSQGLVSYLDTLEFVAFAAKHPEFRPAPIAELAALYNQAWRWIRADYDDNTHMFRVFAYGRGNYSYINPNREWQQTGTSFGKMIMAHAELVAVLEKENITSFPAKPTLPNAARFEFYTKANGKQEGVWVFRGGKLRFTLPITVGTKPAIADYLPAPHGLAGFSAPVEEVYPSMVPFITLADGKTYAAADGADLIVPAPNGRGVSFSTQNWAQIGSKSGDRFANGLKSEVDYVVKNGRVIRRETVTALKDVEIKKWQFAFPSTATSVTENRTATTRTFHLSGRDGSVAVTFEINGSAEIRIFAAGDGKLGKGVLGAIPIHLVAEKGSFRLAAGEKLSWELTIEPK